MQRYYKLRPSPVLKRLFIFLCMASLFSIWMLALPVIWQVALTAAMLGWIGYGLLRYANLSMGHSCVAFRMESLTEIVMVLRSGEHLPGLVALDSFVTPYLVILNVVLNERRGKRSLLILPDTVGEESFRRLCIALRWGDRADQLAM